MTTGLGDGGGLGPPIGRRASEGQTMGAMPSERPTPRSQAERDDQDRIDRDLMMRVAANEEAAVAELYDRFGSLVFRMAFQAMPTRAEAEDAVQEVFVRLWRTADRFDPKRAALVTWVMLISRRHLVDKLRRTRARIKAGRLEDQQPGGDGRGRTAASPLGWEIESREQYAALLERVETLPELQKTVILRAYLGGQTLRQIGEELNTPLGTIKSALSRALLRLRERSGEELKA